MLVMPAFPKGKPAVITTKSFLLINLNFFIISLEIDIISFHPFASLLFIDCTPQSNDTCLLTFMLGDIVTIYDWKSKTNDPEFVTEWNLGCNGDTYSNVFLDQVMDFIKKGVDADNLVC